MPTPAIVPLSVFLRFWILICPVATETLRSTQRKNLLGFPQLRASFSWILAIERLNSRYGDRFQPDVCRMSVPVLPRRAFVAAVFSGVTAASALALGLYGGLTTPMRAQFGFSRGVSWAAQELERLRGFLAPALEDNRIHVTILGHSGNTGDAAANLELSVARADLARTVAQDLGISADRLTVQGLGGGRPLAKMDGESARAYQSRLSRVEVTLQLRK